MKGKFTRLLALLLMFTLLLSVFTVFISAEETEDEEKVDEYVELGWNRTYDEGWAITNGFRADSGPSASDDENFHIDYEEDINGDRNYFVRFEFGERTADVYFQQYLSGFKTYTVLQFDVMIDGQMSYIGRFAYTQISSGLGQNSILGINADGNWTAMGVEMCPYTSEWVTMTYVFDWTDMKEDINDKGQVQPYGSCTVMATDREGNLLNMSGKPDVVKKAYTLNAFRLGIHTTTVPGESYCFDNLRYYHTTSGRVLSTEELNELGCGSMVNKNAEIVIDIQGNGAVGAGTSAMKGSAAYKVGVNRFLKNGDTAANILTADNGEAYGAPVVIDGKVFVALQPVLDHLGYSYYSHSNGAAYDISSGQTATSIYADRTSAIADGKDVYLTAPPTYLHQTIGGKEYSYLAVCMDDIEQLFPGVYVDYDTMGLFVISKHDGLISRDNLSAMLSLMKKFIFDNPTGAVIREAVSLKTEAENGAALQHPYIYATQPTFDHLKSVYEAKVGDADFDPLLTKFLGNSVSGLRSWLETWATIVYANDEGYAQALKDYQENGVGIMFSDGVICLPELTAKPGNIYDPTHVGRRAHTNKIITERDAALATNNGYDPAGGRLTEAMGMVDNIVNLAYAYQLTRDENYARIAYDFLAGMAEWNHWGNGHFLNAADTAQYFAVSYDWLYNAFVELNEKYPLGEDAEGEPVLGRYDPQVLANGLYRNAVYDGYLVGVKKTYREGTRQILPGTTHGTIYLTATQNWNAVCNTGVSIAALALLGETDEEKTTYIDTMLGECYNGLVTYGLDCYAPDGSYPESAGYWAYGTTQLFKLIAAYYSATGTDFGLFNAWGLDKTCYYAINVVSNDGYRFGYHDDDGYGDLDSSQFAFVGYLLQDDTISALRFNQIKNGNGCSIFDAFYWNSDLLSNDVELPKSYFMEGIDTYVIRDSWDKGALFVGLHGGPNSVNHGNIDAGTFYYVNKGTEWFCELGGESYTVGNYFGTATRYTYYRTNTEGQNTICITSDQANMKYGQRLEGVAKTLAYGTNEYGGYHILDMESCYDVKDNVFTAYRGLYVTNDFKTTVLQDNIRFNGFTSMWWFAHTTCEIEIDASGKVAYLKDANDNILRCTLVTRARGYAFEVLSAYDTKLNATLSVKDNNKQADRSAYKKLAISGIDTLDFNCAVVFEMIESKTDAPECAYTLEMYGKGLFDTFTGEVTWKPFPEKVQSNVGVNNSLVIVPFIPNFKISQNTMAEAVTFIGYIPFERRFNTNMEDMYNKLASVEYAMQAYYFDNDPNLPDYESYKSDYEQVQEATNTNSQNIFKVANSLLGL